MLRGLSNSTLAILLALNLCGTMVLAWKNTGQKTVESTDLVVLLQDIAEKDPQFFVSLLNKSANQANDKRQSSFTQSVLAKKDEILSLGIALKTLEGANKTLVIFADMTCANCLTYLKKIETALPNLNCSVQLVMMNIFGKKAVAQAVLIQAASLQSAEKALKLALLYNPIVGAKNTIMISAKKLGFDMKKLKNDAKSKHVYEENYIKQDQLSKSLDVGAPGVFLITSDNAYIIPPSEALDIPKLVENPNSSLVEVQ